MIPDFEFIFEIGDQRKLFANGQSLNAAGENDRTLSMESIQCLLLPILLGSLYLAGIMYGGITPIVCFSA